ncbi:sensor histidine kinase [Ahrensia sp. R2A130]|uniref:sensor histidine kinase n=1 Tax=Ahrensia sp. R2A130 TaxID=744979 RepID=UPI0001E0B4B1|nr:sensor protein ChvG [Ahrensia sp. R2A130]
MIRTLRRNSAGDIKRRLSARIAGGAPADSVAGDTQKGDVQKEAAGSPPAQPSKKKQFRKAAWRFGGRVLFTSLTRRIIFLNLAGLVVLLSGILFLNQFRDSLIEAKVESLLTQGEIISGAIAAQATVDIDAITIDPDVLLELQTGESAFPMESETENLDFPINPEQVAPVLRRLISPTRTRARIYDRDGIIILDSDRLYSQGQVLRSDLPSPGGANQRGFLERNWLAFRNWFWQRDLPLYSETLNANGTSYGEVVTALSGRSASETRRNEKGDTIVSVAVPVQRFRAVLGVLLLSTEAGDIDAIIDKERLAIFRTFAVAVAVTALLSILLASTIANPLRRLSAAAERVRKGEQGREAIPEFPDRTDEIGHLGRSLNDMTRSLYDRMDAIESFAADVSHELKNPLTSLRSAVETLPLAKKPEQRERLLEVIEHDVRRLDRLISDISDASRLDAELARENAEPVDLAKLLTDFHATYAHMTGDRVGPMPDVTLDIETIAAPKRQRNKPDWHVAGHAGRLGQVLANLVENARSFVPAEGGRVTMTLSRTGDDAVVTVTDNGPGIPPDNTGRIFERFYTDRPESEGFGQNSGLGLSISQQIIEAHGGEISASNVTGPKGVKGARFTVVLPLFETADKPTGRG